MSYTLAQDSVNPDNIPKTVLACGYTTGFGIAWPARGWVEHPNAVRICQDAGATDTTADVLDVETGAATPADVPKWYRAALFSRVKKVRKGQRYPCIYVNRSNITAVANALTSAGIVTHGPALWLAKPGDSLSVAESDLTQQQPYPMVGEQYSFQNKVDLDVFITDWVNSIGAYAQVTGITTKVLVPNLFGLNGTAAHAALARVGLDYHSTVMPPLCSKQSPVPGTLVNKGTVVELTFD